MGFYVKDSTVTFEWYVYPSASPPAKADLDIKQVLPDKSSTYTNDAVTTYTAPTATTRGKVTYDLTLTQLGLYQVTLEIGVPGTAVLQAYRQVFCVEPPAHVTDGVAGKTTRGPEVIPPASP